MANKGLILLTYKEFVKLHSGWWEKSWLEEHFQGQSVLLQPEMLSDLLCSREQKGINTN